ncbi:DUF4173 domain-containing protein [Streptomyces globosus]|uniref:DUF4173 domain-containing protein n=1 Tax=Streptomyces globosus TaxID=68209 RepID=A0A344TXF7_9ACTN|nr:DUF4173 domain-containing protein [Streptomyces globosus]AXE23328.1 DUF4173 domain-containing protein [Streptomyces globosus]
MATTADGPNDGDAAEAAADATPVAGPPQAADRPDDSLAAAGAAAGPASDAGTPTEAGPLPAPREPEATTPDASAPPAGAAAPDAAAVAVVPAGSPGGGAPPGWDPTAWRRYQVRRERARSGPWSAAPPDWSEAARPAAPAPPSTAVLVCAGAAGLAAALFLGDGVGPGLLLAALPAVAAAYAAARTAGRTARPWTLFWALGCTALLAVPVLRDAAWPATVALLAAVLAGALALHGSRTWAGVLLSPVGLTDGAVNGVRWAWAALRSRSTGVDRDRWLPVLKAAGVAAGLLLLFGALFASADAAFADLLGGLVPDVTIGDGPLRLALFLLATALALAAARTAAAPFRWDRIRTTVGKPRSRVEWALPLVVLAVLFAGFNAVQLAVLFGGYDKVLASTGLTYAEYARQGFWQLLWATLLTLAVIALALRWAPRGGAADRRLVRAVLGTLCALTLVVVASALRRMDLYVDAYGLTRLRVSVAAMELWLGSVIVLIMTAGLFGARLLPRAVAGSAVAAALAFGLLSPDAVVAEKNADRFRATGKIDLAYFQSLSADAVPALDRLPEPHRSCALRGIAEELAEQGRAPWYGTSLGVHRARRILDERPVTARAAACSRLGTFSGRSG